MKLTFEPAARDDLERIYTWISKNNPRAARDMIARIEARAMLLTSASLAHIERLGLVEDTRELVECPYLIVYRVDEALDEVIVVGLFHGAQDR